MSSSAFSRGAGPPAPFALLLKMQRQKRRLSQLELALRCEVSQRHLSFLESGRANPSRSMILRLSDQLEVPLRERNSWLMAAGFAPVFSERRLEDPSMALVFSAVQRILRSQEPFPAIAVDRLWNIRYANEAFEDLVGMFGQEVWKAVGGEGRNVMRLFFHRRGIRAHVSNWSAIAPLLWHRAEREAEGIGGEELRQLLEELRGEEAGAERWEGETAVLLPVLPVRLRGVGGELSLFSVLSTFGTAQDVLAEELRIESFFPADGGTEEWFWRRGEKRNGLIDGSGR